MLSKLMPDTDPVPPCHVLIRTPLSEFLIIAFLTVMFDTHAWELCTPRLPMLRHTCVRFSDHEIIRDTPVAESFEPDAMAWPASNIGYVDVGTARTNRDAVVAYGHHETVGLVLLEEKGAGLGRGQWSRDHCLSRNCRWRRTWCSRYGCRRCWDSEQGT